MAESLEIAGLSMTTPGWLVIDHTPLMDVATTVGESRRLPGGRVLSYPQRVTETVKDIPMMIFGHIAQNGSSYADHLAGMKTNVDTLMAVLGPVTSGDGTRSAIWHLPGGGTLTARVKTRLELGERNVSTLRAMLVLTLPDGRFE